MDIWGKAQHAKLCRTAAGLISKHLHVLRAGFPSTSDTLCLLYFTTTRESYDSYLGGNHSIDISLQPPKRTYGISQHSFKTAQFEYKNRYCH